MTLRQLQKLAKDLGMSVRKTQAGDYRIAYKGMSPKRAEETSCYEDSVDSAYKTMAAMIRWGR